jgi:hypothetical protein
VSTGPHAFGSGTSYLLLDGAFTVSGAASLQSGWHWCTVCQGLIYPPGGNTENTGVCPVNYQSPHTVGDTVYWVFDTQF